MSKLAMVSWALFFLLMLGLVTHTLSSGGFSIGMLILVLLLGIDFYNKKASPQAKAATNRNAAVREAAVNAPIPAGHGVIYVYREGSLLTAGLAEAAPDGLTPVDLRPRSFARWILPAGEHSLRADVKGKNLFADNPGGDSVFTLAPGETAIFRLSMAMDLKKFSVSLGRETDAAAAMTKLSRLSLAGLAAVS